MLSKSIDTEDVEKIDRRNIVQADHKQVEKEQTGAIDLHIDVEIEKHSTT